MIYACGRNDSPNGVKVIDTTSRSKTWSKGLSPFVIGPCKLYAKYVAKNMENAWQFCKVYKRHVDCDGDPTPEYFQWAEKGWNDTYAHRYPMGKGAIPEYSYWNGEKLDYIEARERIYIPLYKSAVSKTAAWKQLEFEYVMNGDLALWDFDGYNHRDLRMSWEDVINDTRHKMGHSLVLAMMLDGYM